ncbi:hypothetical protein WCLP8_1750008 [uncultured Gammaproteobacteria bacterium]
MFRELRMFSDEEENDGAWLNFAPHPDPSSDSVAPPVTEGWVPDDLETDPAMPPVPQSAEAGCTPSGFADSDSDLALSDALGDSEPLSASASASGPADENGGVPSLLSRVIDTHMGGLKREAPYSITIDGHRTSVRLEPYMWDSLQDICLREGIDVHSLCTFIANRHQGRRNLSSAIRVFIMAYYRQVAVEHGLLPIPDTNGREGPRKGFHEASVEFEYPPFNVFQANVFQAEAGQACPSQPNAPTGAEAEDTVELGPGRLSDGQLHK